MVEQLYNTAQAAKMVGWSRDKLRKEVNANNLQHIRIPGENGKPQTVRLYFTVAHIEAIRKFRGMVEVGG